MTVLGYGRMVDQRAKHGSKGPTGHLSRDQHGHTNLHAWRRSGAATERTGPVRSIRAALQRPLLQEFPVERVIGELQPTSVAALQQYSAKQWQCSAYQLHSLWHPSIDDVRNLM